MLYRFADCEVCTDTHTLWRAGSPVPVQPKVFALLVLLLRHRDELSSEGAIAAELWPELRVAETSLRRLVKEARRAVGDDGERQQIIRTVRGRGYRFVAPAVTDAWDDRLIVGRRRLLGALEASLEAALRGVGRMVLLEGAGGMGKTLIARAMGSRARRLGATAVHVAGGQSSVSSPHGVWLEAIRSLTAARPALREQLPAGWSALLARSTVGMETPSATQSKQLRLLEELHEFLAAAAHRQPLALVVDDLHEADRESLHALSFLAPRLAGAPVWLLGCHRGETAAFPSPAPLAELGDGRHADTWVLDGLSAEEVATLVEARTGETGWMDLATLLVRRTGGNPFWVDAVLRDLVARDLLRSAVPLDAIEAEIPARLRPVLRRRLGAVSPATEQLLQVAAALGTTFDAALLADIARRSRPEVNGALESAATAQLITRERLPDAAWRFTHDLIREGIYASLDEQPGERERLHLRIVRALERGESPDAAARVHHARRALPLVAREEVLALHVEAADQAVATRAYREAIGHYEAALALLSIDEEDGEQRRPQLLLALADATLVAEGLDAARRVYSQAAQSARRSGDGDVLARAALGFAFRRAAMGRADEQIVALIGEALAALGPSAPALAIRLRSRLGSELLLAEPRARGEEMVAAALADARALADPRVLGWVLEDQSFAFWSPRDTRGWIELCREVERVGRSVDDPDLAFRGARAQATGCLELGDRAGLDAAIETCERLVRERPLQHARALVAGMHGMRALLDGRLEEARRHVNTSAELGAGSGDLGLHAQVGVQLFLIHREEGTLDRLEPMLAPLRERYGAVWGLRLLGALADAEAGRHEAARARLEAFEREALEHLPLDRNWLPTLVTAAEIAALVEAASVAEAVESRLTPFAGLNAVVGSCGACFGSIARALGLAALARGHSAVAVDHLEAATAMHARLRAPLWLARSEAERVQAIARRDAALA